MAQWNTRFEVQKRHIIWREEFYQVKFNIFQKAYAHFRMLFVNKDTIIGANCTLASHVRDYGTASNFAKEIGDTAFDARKGLRFTDGVKKVLSWTIRAPFIVLGVTAYLVHEWCQAICQRLPGSVE